jgi:hypothetical protein
MQVSGPQISQPDIAACRQTATCWHGAQVCLLTVQKASQRGCRDPYHHVLPAVQEQLLSLPMLQLRLKADNTVQTLVDALSRNGVTYHSKCLDKTYSLVCEAIKHGLCQEFIAEFAALVKSRRCLKLVKFTMDNASVTLNNKQQTCSRIPKVQGE